MTVCMIERGSSAVECRTCNQESPGSNPSLATVSKFLTCQPEHCLLSGMFNSHKKYNDKQIILKLYIFFFGDIAQENGYKLPDRYCWQSVLYAWTQPD